MRGSIGVGVSGGPDPQEFPNTFFHYIIPEQSLNTCCLPLYLWSPFDWNSDLFTDFYSYLRILSQARLSNFGPPNPSITSVWHDYEWYSTLRYANPAHADDVIGVIFIYSPTPRKVTVHLFTTALSMPFHLFLKRITQSATEQWTLGLLIPHFSTVYDFFQQQPFSLYCPGQSQNDVDDVKSACPGFAYLLVLYHS